MIAKYEDRVYHDNFKVWTGQYENLHNLVHWHRENELIYISKGTADIGINSQIFSGSAGDAFFCASGNIHYIQAKENCICTIFIFDPSLLPSLTDAVTLASPKLECHYEIDKYYELITKELSFRHSFYKSKVTAALLDLTAEIYRNERKMTDGCSPYVQNLQAYRRLLGYIDENYSSITFREAAKQMGFTESYFSKMFVRLSGISFTDYLNSIRIEKAIEMLKKRDHNITETAALCGFNSIRHFNRIFKKLTGYTPRQLPSDFVMETIAAKTLNARFDPTIPSSRLLDKENE